MNRLYFSKFLLAVAVVLGCSINAIAQTTVTFTYPSTQTRLYTVPFGASYMDVDIKGARGGYSASLGSPASGNGANGNGAEVLARIAVTGGQVFQINLGSAGINCGNTGDNYTQWSGGANGGGAGYGRGAGGGGASDLRNLSYAITNRIVVAAGGGGWGGAGGGGVYCAGGCGGGLTGDAGWWGNSHTTSNAQNCGQGGTQNSGGAKANVGYDPTNGSLGQGGNASTVTANPSAYGGGGGGGYYGGGGGVYGGGGGGSSYTDPAYVTSGFTSLFQCANDADGSITITTDCSAPVKGRIVGPRFVCACSGTVSFTNPTSSGGGTWASNNSGVINFPSAGTPTANVGCGVTSPTQVIVTHTITYGCFSPASDTFMITVNPLPDNITSDGAFAPIKPMCAGSTQTAFASGPGVWSSSNTNIATAVGLGGSGSGLGLLTAIAGGSAVITYTLPTGCRSLATATVNPIPLPINTAAPASVCQGTPCVTFSDASGGGTWSIDNSFTTIGSTSGVVCTGTPGSGNIVYKFPSTGCFVSRPFTVSALPSNAPSIQIQQEGGPARCSNGPGIRLYHAFTEAGNRYAIYRNGVAIDSAIGDGTELSYGKMTAAGVYSVIATSPGGCVTKMTGTATITVDPAPTAYPFFLDGPAKFCLDPGVGRKIILNNTESGILNVGNMYYTIYRDGLPAEVLTTNPTASNPSVMSSLITTGGTYTMDATDPDGANGTGCVTTLTGSYTITPQPLPPIDTLIGGGFYCLGGVGVPVCMKNSLSGITYDLYNSGYLTTHPGTGAGFCFGTSGLIKDVGTYSVTETNFSTGCQSQAYVPNPVVVGIYPATQKDTIEGSAHICANSTTGAVIDLKNSVTGVKYQLYKDNVAVGGLVDGTTGSMVSLGAQFLGGVYTATGTDQTTQCTSNMVGSAVIVIDAIPTAENVSGGGAFCTGSNPSTKDVILNASESDVIYQRIRVGSPVGFPVPGDIFGGSISLGTDTATGVFTVMGTSTVNGCSNMMNGSATVAINALPKRYAVSGGGNYCIGDVGVNINMPHSGLGVSYQLFESSGAPVSVVVPGSNAGIDFGIYTATGNYYVMGTNVTTTCMDTMSNSVNVTNSPKPDIYAVTGTGSSYCSGDPGIDIMLSSSQAGVRYQFYRSALAIGAPVDGTGLMLDFGLQTLPGAYSITAADTITGCKDTMFGKAVVVINSLPAVYAVGGGGNYCAGDAGLHVTLSKSQLGINYQLYNMSLPVGAPVPGTGNALDFGLQTAGGTYTVIAVNPSTTCVSNMSGSVNINVRTLPLQYHVGGGGDICVGSTGTNIMLSGSETGVTYRLYNNGVAIDAPIAGTTGTINFGIHSAAGTYSVKGTRTATGCANWMSDVTVINVNPLPTAYTLSGASTFCAGAPGTHITNSGSVVGVNYQLMNGLTPVGMYITGTGTALDFGVPATSGNYDVVATDALTGCSNKTLASVKVTINPLPAVQSMTGGGHYCVAKSGAPMGLSSSDAGINYQLYRGGSAVGGLMPGGGYPVNFGLQKIAGTYTAVGINALTGCTQNMTGTSVVTIDAITPPAVSISTITGGDTLCAGTSYTFTAVPVNGGTIPDFAWSVNGGPAIAYGSTYTYVPANGDIVGVKLTSNADCAVPTTATSNKIITTQPYILPAATLATDPGDAVCAGTSVTFTATPVSDGYMQNYNWVKNGVVETSLYGKLSYTYAPKDKDVVIFMLGSTYPCRLKDTVFSNTYSMIVDPGVAPVVTLIATQSTKLAPGQMDTFLAVATNVGLFPKYQWLNNGAPIIGATTNRYISNQFFDKDVIACMVTSSLPCGLTAMNSTVIEITKSTGVNNSNTNVSDIRVMPNPSKGEFSVKGSIGVRTDAAVSLEITNMLGQTVYNKNVTANNGSVNEQIQLGNVAAGMYLLSVRSAAGSNVYHIVIEK